MHAFGIGSQPISPVQSVHVELCALSAVQCSEFTRSHWYWPPYLDIIIMDMDYKYNMGRLFWNADKNEFENEPCQNHVSERWQTQSSFVFCLLKHTYCVHIGPFQANFCIWFGEIAGAMCCVILLYNLAQHAVNHSSCSLFTYYAISCLTYNYWLVLSMLAVLSFLVQ